MNLKLYVWHDALEGGSMFALANSPEEAREALRKVDGWWEGGAMERDMAAEPSAYDVPVGFAVWGGD